MRSSLVCLVQVVSKHRHSSCSDFCHDDILNILLTGHIVDDRWPLGAPISKTTPNLSNTRREQIWPRITGAVPIDYGPQSTMDSIRFKVRHNPGSMVPVRVHGITGIQRQDLWAPYRGRAQDHQKYGPGATREASG